MDHSNYKFLGAMYFAAAAAIVVSCCWRNSSIKNKPSHDSATKVSGSRGYDKEYYPPLPSAVVKLLQGSRLCFLATTGLSSGEPHLSLMNFTYLQSEELIILCTRQNTKKYNMIEQSNKVAILIHDFPHQRSADIDEDNYHGKSWSITLNGTIIISPHSTFFIIIHSTFRLTNLLFS